MILQRGPQCGHRGKLEDKLKKPILSKVGEFCDSSTVLRVKRCLVSLKIGKRE